MSRPTADINDVFRTISGEAPRPTESGSFGMFLAIVFLVAATVAGAMLIRRYVIYRRTMAYQRHRMERSIARELELTREQHRDLRRFAKQRGVNTPLTLLLCPSLLKRSLRNAGDAEREAVEKLLAKAA
ncbi:MAG: hypothetical protein AAGD32_09825 [Planctomycetota bacterium]